jgi:hypothetical protein
MTTNCQLWLASIRGDLSLGSHNFGYRVAGEVWEDGWEEMVSWRA